MQPHLGREHLIFQDPIKGEPEKMAASTIFPYTDPKDGLAVLVSYEVKVAAGPIITTASF